MPIITTATAAQHNDTTDDNVHHINTKEIIQNLEEIPAKIVEITPQGKAVIVTSLNDIRTNYYGNKTIDSHFYPLTWTDEQIIEFSNSNRSQQNQILHTIRLKNKIINNNKATQSLQKRIEEYIPDETPLQVQEA